MFYCVCSKKGDVMLFAIHRDDVGKNPRDCRPFCKGEGEPADMLAWVLSNMDCTFPVAIVNDDGVMLTHCGRF